MSQYETTQPPSDAPSDATDSEAGPRLLAIDDHPDAAELVVRVAERAGYAARQACKPRDVRTLLSDWQPDILTTDLCMPELDGIEMFKVLREVGYQGDVVLISGQHDDLRASAAKLAQMQGLRVVGNLQKPFGIRQLRDLLQRLREAAA